MTIICGHRGASGYAPENTITAFRHAQTMGATWLEFDVQLCKSGEVIVLHDDTLERTTSLKEKIRPTELSLAELKKLDAGSWFSAEFVGEPIPTLEEVLREFGGTLGLNVEIKSKIGFESDNGIEAKVIELVRRYKLEDSVVISSFDPTRLVKIFQLDPGLKLGALYDSKAYEYLPNFEPLKLAQSFGAVAIHPSFKLVDATLVEHARQAGMLINTWTVNENTDMQRMFDLGVNMIITNYPDRAKALLAA